MLCASVSAIAVRGRSFDAMFVCARFTCRPATSAGNAHLTGIRATVKLGYSLLGLGARSLKGLSCAGAFAIFAAIGLAGAAIAAQAQNSTKDSTNAAICAPSDETAVSPEQRIAACTALIETLKDQPKALAAVLTDRGATYWYINKSDLALKDLGHAIALDPTNARAFRERANTYRNLGRLDRALADANTSVQLDPNDPKAFDNRGNVFIDNRQYDRALADFNEALRLKPDFALAYHDRGDAFYFKQDYAASIKDLDEAIRLDPKSARAFTDRASTYAKLGRIDQAIAADTEAIRLEPLTPEFFDNRGLAYADNGDYDRAIADYNEAIRRGPKPSFSTTAAIPTITKATTTAPSPTTIAPLRPDLSRLDREIDAAYKAALASRNGKAAAQLRQDQRDFLAVRNKSFGNPQYNLRREMELRLAALRGMSARTN